MSSNHSLRLPDFIGVGPPRTATTWLHEALSGYVGLPEGVKETDFFVWQYDKGLQWYAAHFRNCPLDRPVGEFSAAYFVGPQTRERIVRHIPQCKIICTLRDPVERTHSHYRLLREGEYFSGSFEECLQKRSDILDWSKYATHVKAWRDLFGEKNVLVLLQHDLKLDPQAFLNQVCDFLRIPRIEYTNSGSQARMVNAISRLPRNAGLARTARIVKEYLRRRGSYGIVNLIKRTGLHDFLWSGGPPFEPVRPETAAHLREYFRPEVEELEKMLGRELSAWKTGPTQRATRAESHEVLSDK